MLGQIAETGCVKKLNQFSGGDRAASDQKSRVNEAGARKFGRVRMKPNRHKHCSARFQGTDDVMNTVDERVSRNEPLRNPRQVVAILIV